jgi:hypothetical protein
MNPRAGGYLRYLKQAPDNGNGPASAGVFKSDPGGVPLSEQKLSIPTHMCSPSAIIDLLKTAVRKKLIDVLSEVREEVLQLILPDVA